MQASSDLRNEESLWTVKDFGTDETERLRVLLRVLRPDSLSFCVLWCTLVSLCVPHRMAMRSRCGVKDV